jgi:predicted nucleotidyltransferase
MGLPAGDTKERALRELTEVLHAAGTRYALIGGVAIQLYSEEPRTTLDLDVALASYDDIPRAQLEAAGWKHEGTFSHSDNWRAPGPEPRKQRTPVQFTVDRLTPGAVERAETFKVGDLAIKVAALPDLVLLKLEAAEEPRRRPSKQVSDVRDVMTLLEEHPELEVVVPDARERVRRALVHASQEAKASESQPASPGHAEPKK